MISDSAALLREHVVNLTVPFSSISANRFAGFAGELNHPVLRYLSSGRAVRRRVEACWSPIMSHVPAVSIGMPVYNGERTLRESVDSILSQTFSDFELIISDNASADGTEAICRTYVERDSRVAYHRQPQNLGITENYNTVFRLSNAPYFKWASSSDICMPEFLSKCVAVQQNHSDVVLCYPRTRLFDSRTSDAEDYLIQYSGQQVIQHILTTS